MIPYLSERENAIEQVNSICMRLFDTWCETRGVTPLAYLMHCWPMIDVTPVGLRRVGDTMRDLRRYHSDQLDEDSFLALCEMAELIDELVEGPARAVRIMAVGETVERHG
jgi:hypothetical protein